MNGYLVLEGGETYQGQWLGGADRAGEIVFNTSHNGYEEIATDPSYYGQIMVMCAPQQGNYGVDKIFWESSNLWVEGFVCLDMQNSEECTAWLNRLDESSIPSMDSVDTRSLVLSLREKGTQLGALVQANSEEEAHSKANALIEKFKGKDKDWAHAVSRKEVEVKNGAASSGPRVAIIDYGCKKNIVREMIKRCSEIKIFPSRTPAAEIMEWHPDGILLSNGPGDPADVQEAKDIVKELVGRVPIFGICMGHHILGLALGGKTFKLKFGHRGANHPIRNELTGEIYVTSQNHGYAIDLESLPSDVELTHMNLNDKTVSGIQCTSKKCFSVQFHPESHPGPRDAEPLFNQFVEWIKDDI